MNLKFSYQNIKEFTTIEELVEETNISRPTLTKYLKGLNTTSKQYIVDTINKAASLLKARKIKELQGMGV